MSNDLDKLILELKQEGATDKEAEELALLSKNFSNSIKIERSFEIKTKFLRQKNTSKNFFSLHRQLFAYVLVILFFISFSTLVSAQDSLPGQPLYPVKRISEDIARKVSPSFKGEILKRRSQEVKLLSDPRNKKNSTNLINAIKDYENELSDNKVVNNKIIKESGDNLRDASRVASDGSKLEIEHILRQTEDRRKEVEKEDSSNFNQNHTEESPRE